MSAATETVDAPAIRSARPNDNAALLALRNHYVANSTATFDEQLLTADDIANWMRGFADTGRYRLLVAEREGKILGFASSQPYRAHPAFRLTVETSIYVDPGCAGGGVGSRLYAALFGAIKDEALHRALVGIALPNEASVRLHRKLGFTDVGRFDEYAIKGREFISSAWMQLKLPFAALERTSDQSASLIDFMQASPYSGAHEPLVLERDGSLTRDLDL